MNISLTGKARLIVLLALGMLVMSLVARDGGPALLALPLVVYIAAGLLTAPDAGHLRLRAGRELEAPRAETGQKVTMRLWIENQGVAAPRIEAGDDLPAGIEIIDGESSDVCALPSGNRLELIYNFRAGRGRYLWRGLRAAVSDPFGLFETRLELAAPGTLYVLPPNSVHKGLRLRPRQTRPTVGPHLSRRAGFGTDFYGLREYHPGDSLRRIAWRRSARHPGEFFSREFEREEMADIGLLLDARAAANLHRDGDQLLDHSIRAASALADGCLNAGDRLSLLVLGEHVARVFPGAGRRQKLAVQDALAACRPGEKVSFQTLKYLPVRLFPSRSTLVIVSPLLGGDLGPLSRLSAEGYQVIVVSPDPVDFTGQVSNQAEILGARVAALERRLLLWQAREQGIVVIPWKVDEPFTTVLRSPYWRKP